MYYICLIVWNLLYVFQAEVKHVIQLCPVCLKNQPDSTHNACTSTENHRLCKGENHRLHVHMWVKVLYSTLVDLQRYDVISFPCRMYCQIYQVPAVLCSLNENTFRIATYTCIVYSIYIFHGYSIFQHLCNRSL